MRTQLQMKDVQLQVLYERYLSARIDQNERLLGAVTEYMKPILSSFIAQQMSGRSRQEQEDVYGLTIQIILRKLQEKREQNQQIVDLRAYMVTIVRHEIFRYCHSLQNLSKQTLSLETMESPRETQEGLAKTPTSLQTRDVGTSVLHNDYLRTIWNIIRQFPPRQCGALLLQSSDPNGTSMVDLLELCRIASHQEMAAAIGMTSEEFGVWREDVPAPDAKIGARYGQPAQSIARLRMMARRKMEEALSSQETKALAAGAINGGKYE